LGRAVIGGGRVSVHGALVDRVLSLRIAAIDPTKARIVGAMGSRRGDWPGGTSVGGLSCPCRVGGVTGEQAVVLG